MHEYEYVGIQPGRQYAPQYAPMMARPRHPDDVVGIQPGGLSEIVGVGYPLQEIVGYPAYAQPRYARVAAMPYPHQRMVHGVHGGYVGQDVTAPGAQLVGPQVATVAPRNVREFAIGFGPTSAKIAAGGTAIVAAQPQILFRGSRLVVPSALGGDMIAVNFTLNDIRVGKDSQFVSAGPLPAISYLENAVGTAMGLDTCNVGQLITLNVTNFDVAPHRFFASLFGTSVQ